MHRTDALSEPIQYVLIPVLLPMTQVPILPCQSAGQILKGLRINLTPFALAISQ